MEAGNNIKTPNGGVPFIERGKKESGTKEEERRVKKEIREKGEERRGERDEANFFCGRN